MFSIKLLFVLFILSFTTIQSFLPQKGYVLKNQVFRKSSKNLLFDVINDVHPLLTTDNLSLNLNQPVFKNKNHQHIYEESKAAIVSISAGAIISGVIIAVKQIILGFDKGYHAKHPILTPLIAGLLSNIISNILPSSLNHTFPKITNNVIQETPLLLGNIFFRYILLILSMSFGISLGIAGPAAEIGMIFAFAIGLLLRSKHRIKEFLLAGAAAGVAANFNAPFTGVLFALEVTSSTMESKDSTNYNKFIGIMILMVASAVFTFRKGLLPAGKAILQTQPIKNLGIDTLLMLSSIGVLSGVVFELFSLFKTKYSEFHSQLRIPIGKAIIAGVFCSLAAGLGFSQALSLGFPSVNAITMDLFSNSQLATQFIIRFFLAAICSAGGFVGGLLAPLFFLGANLGGLFFNLVKIVLPNFLQTCDITLCALMGSACLVACNFKAPLMATFLVIELTRSFDYAIPLLFSIYLSLFTSNTVKRLISFEKK